VYKVKEPCQANEQSQAFLADTLGIPASALSNVTELYLELYHSAMPAGRSARNYYEAMRALSVEDAVMPPPARTVQFCQSWGESFPSSELAEMCRGSLAGATGGGAIPRTHRKQLPGRRADHNHDGEPDTNLRPTSQRRNNGRTLPSRARLVCAYGISWRIAR
jgi:hypothetical protein